MSGLRFQPATGVLMKLLAHVPRGLYKAKKEMASFFCVDMARWQISALQSLRKRLTMLLVG